MIHRYATVEGVHHAIQTDPTVQDGHLVVVPAVGEAAVVCGTFPIAFQVPNQAAYAASALSLYTKAFAYEGSIWNSSAVDRTEITARGKQMVEYMNSLPAEAFANMLQTGELFTAETAAERFEFGLDILLGGLTALT